MYCPNCKKDFELTWGTYALNPRGHYPCTMCGRRVVSILPFSYKLDLLGVMLLAAAGPFGWGVVMSESEAGLWAFFGLGIGVAALVGVWMDKRVESRCTKTRLVKEKG